jgi:hypothetical protein
MSPHCATTGWYPIELAKLIVGVLTPLSVALFGWFVSRRLKQLDLVLWSNQKLIEKRLAVFDQVAPLLNGLLCFYTWVGYWKDISPEDVVKAKRELDKTMNIYRHLFDDRIYADYQAFMQVLFETYTGPGHNARIRSQVASADGDRAHDATYEWVDAWATAFADPAAVPPRQEVSDRYRALMTSLTRSLGVAHDGPPRA